MIEVGLGIVLPDLTITRSGDNLIITGGASLTIIDLFVEKALETMHFQPDDTTLDLLSFLKVAPVAQDDAFDIDEDEVLNGSVLADNGMGRTWIPMQTF